MDGMTGVATREQIMSSINKFYNESEDTFKHIFDQTVDFFETIKKKWCSPNAVDFSKEYGSKMIDTIHSAQDIICEICKKVEDAYNAYAPINGTDTLTMNLFPHYGLYYCEFLPANEDGVVGMEKTTVRNALESYKRAMLVEGNNYGPGYLNRLSQNSVEYLFMDSSNEQITAYREMFNKANQSIKDMFSDIVSQIEANIGIEVDKLMKSQREAVEALRHQW